MFLVLWIAGALIWPAEYAAFNVALEKATLVANDLGYGYFELMNSFIHSMPISIVLHTMLAATLLYLALFIAPQRLGLSNSPFFRILLAIPFVILANPRMKEYDWFLGVICCVLLACLTLREYARATLLLSALPLALPLFTWWVLLHRGIQMSLNYGMYQLASFLVFLALFVWIRLEHAGELQAISSTTREPA
jgi:hypothetical protein